MGNRKRLFLTVLLSCMLGFSLAACGGGGDEPEAPDSSGGKLGTSDTAAEEPQTTDDDAPDAQEGWGHAVFDNDDGAYTLIDDEEELQRIVEARPDYDESDPASNRLERLYQDASTGRAVVVTFFDDPSLASKDAVHTIAQAIKGNDFLTEYILEDGTEVFFALASDDGSQGAYIFEIVEGKGVYYTSVVAESADGLLECGSRISFAGGPAFSEYLGLALGDESTGSMRVGSDKNGYVDIPSNWTTFNDLGDVDPDMIQYSDIKGNIISMLGIIPQELGYSETPDELAQLTVQSVLETHGQNPEVTAREQDAQQLACGLSSYIVKTEWADGTHMCQLYIVGDDRVYYVACEGDEETVDKIVRSIIDTFDPAA